MYYSEKCLLIFFVIFQTGAQVAKISLVGASLTNAGLVLGLGNPTARSNDQTNRGDSGNLSKRYVERLDQKTEMLITYR